MSFSITAPLLHCFDLLHAQSGGRWEIAPCGVCCFRFPPDGVDAVPTQTVWLRGVFWCHRIAVCLSLTEQALTTMLRSGALSLYQPLVLRGKLPIILLAELIWASLGDYMNHHKYLLPPLPSDIFLLEIDFLLQTELGTDNSSSFAQCNPHILNHESVLWSVLCSFQPYWRQGGVYEWQTPWGQK